jgi:hypothetical protein
MSPSQSGGLVGASALCYIFSMKRAKQRRAGATETFSVSVDPETKNALRRLADAEYAGNLSALVTDLAEEARRRMAAGAYLRRRALRPLDRAGVAALEASIEREMEVARRRRRARRVA